jgi:hypothetical protein
MARHVEASPQRAGKSQQMASPTRLSRLYFEGSLVREVGLRAHAMVESAACNRGATLELFRRNVLNVRREPPLVAAWILHAAMSVAVELGLYL